MTHDITLDTDGDLQELKGVGATVRLFRSSFTYWCLQVTVDKEMIVVDLYAPFQIKADMTRKLFPIKTDLIRRSAERGSGAELIPNDDPPHE